MPMRNKPTSEPKIITTAQGTPIEAGYQDIGDDSEYKLDKY
jgi:hypothetical protein